MQLALMLAEKAEPHMVAGIGEDIAALMSGKITASAPRPLTGGAPKHMRAAKARAAGGSRL
jgi:hypothetical protein